MKKKKKLNGLKVFLLTTCGLLFSFVLISSLVIWNWVKDMPDLDLRKLEEVSQASIIYDKDQNVITNYSYGINKEWVNSEDIPKQLKDAFVSIEDKDFYKHHGIYTKRFIGAILGQITGLADYGGSTITQQLIKNVYLTPELSYKRKAQEFFLAKKIEKMLSKDEILTAYMNAIYMGGQNYGVKAAARDYFNKDLNELTLKEMALIAGLPKSPNGYNPVKNLQKEDLSPSIKRAETVLYTMRQQGKISEQEYKEALNEQFNINTEKKTKGLYPHPHFIEYMINELAYDWAQKEGDLSLVPKLKEKLLEGGYRIYTNMDSKAQSVLEESVHDYKAYPEIVNFDKEKYGEQRAEVASVIIDRSSGGICAIVGGRDLPTTQSSYNRAVHSAQPVGSIIKPLSIFAPAIEKGLGTGSVELDYKLPINGYDNNRWPGGPVLNRPMTMRESMDTSHNVSAARFLYNSVGDDLSMEYLYRLGIKPSRIKKTGQSLVLGTSDSTVMEMARAYTVFTNNGDYVEPKTYIKLEDKDGNILLDASEFQVKRNVFSKSTAFIMNELFKSETTNGTGSKAKIKGITTGGKTGTHEDRVVTYAGISPYYLSVVRVSNDIYLPMKNAWGGTTAASLFSDYMSKIHEGLQDKDIQSTSMADAGVEKAEISKLSGKLANSATRDLKMSSIEFYKKGTVPKEVDNTLIGICGITGNLANNDCYKKKHVKYKLYNGPGSILNGLDLSAISLKLETTSKMPKDRGHTEWQKKKDDEENRKLIEQEEKRNKEEANKNKEEENEDNKSNDEDDIPTTENTYDAIDNEEKQDNTNNSEDNNIDKTDKPEAEEQEGKENKEEKEEKENKKESKGIEEEEENQQ